MLREVLLSLLGGFGQSLQLFCYTLLGALPLGLVIAFGSMNRWRPLREAVRGLVWVIRGTPLMLQLIVVYYGPGLLNNGSHLWGGGTAGRMSAAAVACIINYACYFSEIYRGGIESIPRGQREAGQVLGMTRRQIFFRVQLRQPGPHHRHLRADLRGPGLYQIPRPHLAAAAHGRVLSALLRLPLLAPPPGGEAAELFRVRRGLWRIWR